VSIIFCFAVTRNDSAPGAVAAIAAATAVAVVDNSACIIKWVHHDEGKDELRGD